MVVVAAILFFDLLRLNVWEIAILSVCAFFLLCDCARQSNATSERTDPSRGDSVRIECGRLLQRRFRVSSVICSISASASPVDERHFLLTLTRLVAGMRAPPILNVAALHVALRGDIFAMSVQRHETDDIDAAGHALYLDLSSGMLTPERLAIIFHWAARLVECARAIDAASIIVSPRACHTDSESLVLTHFTSQVACFTTVVLHSVDECRRRQLRNRWLQLSFTLHPRRSRIVARCRDLQDRYPPFEIVYDDDDDTLSCSVEKRLRALHSALAPVLYASPRTLLA